MTELKYSIENPGWVDDAAVSPLILIKEDIKYYSHILDGPKYIIVLFFCKNIININIYLLHALIPGFFLIQGY